MLLEGVDLFQFGGMTSVVHTIDDIDQTVQAFGRALDRMVDEGARSRDRAAVTRRASSLMR